MTIELTLDETVPADSTVTPWAAVTCLSLLTFLLVGLEFMPVSLLTPIAQDLAISEGQAGQAIAVSGLFAVITSLFGNAFLARLDRKTVVLLYTAVLVASSLAVALAPNFLVFLVGRALVGISIGGFWSLSTAILARLASGADLPKAIALLQGGTAFAVVIAAPLGSFLGGLIGWRGTFFITVPIGLAALVWQLAVLPKMPATAAVSVARIFGLLRNRRFAIGMAATSLAFIGQNALSIYLRPFLESVTGVELNGLSMMLLGLGIGGLAGTSIVGFVLRRHLAALLIGLPSGLAMLALLLIALGPFTAVTAALLVLWGVFTTPIPVAWNTWMTRIIPGELEAGGGLQVALIQFAIAGGAFAGGVLFDTAGWWSAFLLAAVLLAGSALLAALASPRT
ncbi:putative MFS family arabinose efflux permease [Rhizobium sp. BK077]|uniref:MFS transporter n=1 Tax=unclassified Rhizobium TaxID=2613769 RepID=UPI00160D9210|nr:MULTISPECIES: MFS transporter [unclassified Rhizobium]MBB3301722.1 putative MFS family arabinose efflux permease [Rhizobium sp. BK112]MBB3370808.1 putative MFS family arabinose efflux permease [Rhizobium sp. BK077]MBB4181576.1 putative MFS family arabinose efflux permease [Rhizobium sp. BK109]MBB4254952.1 putative MFS family arabinose efflux permease [Rhizobium sp. BK008]